MRVWTCTNFDGYWPVGTSAVVIAENEEVALYWLVKELKRIGLPGTCHGLPLTKDRLKPLPTQGGRLVRILQDGNY